MSTELREYMHERLTRRAQEMTYAQRVRAGYLQAASFHSLHPESPASEHLQQCREFMTLGEYEGASNFWDSL